MSWLNLRKKKTEPEAPKHLAVHPHTNLPQRIGAEVKQSAPPAAVPVVRATVEASADIWVLRRPHISERASEQSAKGVCVFKVSPDVTKRQIRAAVASLYKVTVERVRTVTVHPKRIIVKGKRGVRRGGKKAYVYLKAGERIDNL